MSTDNPTEIAQVVSPKARDPRQRYRLRAQGGLPVTEFATPLGTDSRALGKPTRLSELESRRAQGHPGRSGQAQGRAVGRPQFGLLQLAPPAIGPATGRFDRPLTLGRLELERETMIGARSAQPRLQ